MNFYECEVGKRYQHRATRRICEIIHKTEKQICYIGEASGSMFIADLKTIPTEQVGWQEYREPLIRYVVMAGTNIVTFFKLKSDAERSASRYVGGYVVKMVEEREGDK